MFFPVHSHSPFRDLRRSFFPRIQCSIIRPSEIDVGLAAAWSSLRAGNDIYRSPFFSVCFAQAVAEVREDARIAVFENGNETLGVLPFQSLSKRIIVPLGGAYNDLHGLMGNLGGANEFVELLPQLGFDAFRFHAMVENPSATTANCNYGTTKAFLADLGAHPEGYVKFLETTRQTIFKQRKKSRKIAKDLGPLRLEFDCRDPQVLDRVIEMKRAQYQRTYIFDLLSVPWARRMLHALLEKHDRPCRGILSVLYAGDTLVAGHYGMIEGSMMHYWFPVYDHEHHQNSPGTALFLAIAEEATRAGITKIDFGYGEQPYKVKLTDTITELPFGSADRSVVRWLGHRCSTWLNDCRSNLPFKESLKPFIRRLLPNLDGSQYR